jgi:hypothetical protein
MKKTKLLLEPIQKRMLYLTTGLLWLTGTWWLLRPAPLWLKIHGAAAMAFLIIFGTLLIQHVPAGWRQGDQRPSGGFLLTVCSILIVSGWGLYYLGDESMRHWTSIIHSVFGVALPIVIFAHVWSARRPL